MLDKENAVARTGIFMIDASKGFIKDGNKNRLREQDIHRIVDTFNRQIDIPRYARMVPFAEIADPRNDYNLNLPRYIDSSEPEDIQDIDGHLRGGIPQPDLDALDRYWQVIPGVRAALFEPERPGYARLRVPIAEVKPAIFGHAEFAEFNALAMALVEQWLAANIQRLKGFGKDGHPKPLIEALSEDLLARFRAAPLLDAYDVYQHLMDLWAGELQDDCYLISADGWRAGARPRELVQVKNRDGKLVWPETEDFRKGRRRFKSDLVPRAVMITRYFVAERDAMEAIESELATIEQQMDEAREEQGGEDGLLSEVIEGEGEKQKITAKAIKARLKEIGKDPDYADERQALAAYGALLEQQDGTKKRLKVAEDELEAKLEAKYRALTEDEVKTLVVDDRWLATIEADVHGALDRVSQSLTGRVRQLAERYEVPLAALTEEAASLWMRVDAHLQKMRAPIA